jgi:hypothetical protein
MKTPRIQAFVDLAAGAVLSYLATLERFPLGKLAGAPQATQPGCPWPEDEARTQPRPGKERRP